MAIDPRLGFTINTPGLGVNDKWVILNNRNYWWKLIYGIDFRSDFNESMWKLDKLNHPEDEDGWTNLQKEFMVFRYECHMTPTSDELRKMSESIKKIREERKRGNQS